MSLELLRIDRGEKLLLASPDVGWFTRAPAPGTALAPGQRAGILRRLGDAVPLLVPAGVFGRVAGELPELVMTPVGYGDPLFTLTPLGGELEDHAAQETAPTEGQLVLRAEGSGRFYHRPAPGQPPFVSPGEILEPGRVVGLIEVMKTFTHVTYQVAPARSGPALPPRARVLRALVEDGADVTRGTALFALEEA